MTAAARAEDVFRALSEPTRRAILDALAGGERTVSELCALFSITQSAVSQHLRVLREAGLVEPRALGRHRYYRLDARPLRAVHDWAGHYQRFWTQKLDHAGAVLEREAARERKVPAVRDRIARNGADPPTRRAARPRR